MADITIYPYGTNGELPAGIAIVNDLITGGADKALSAEQGKVLNQRITQKGDYVFETRFQTACEVAHTQQTDWNNVSIDTISENTTYKDNCVLYLPPTYTNIGEPTKLIIFCKQGSSKIGVNSSNDWAESTKGRSPILSLPFMAYLISIGYAVVAADGEPDEWLESLGLGTSSGSSSTPADLRAYGNYITVQSTRRAYEYVTKNYNIDTNGCYIFGYSQGGIYAQNVIELSEIPILAAAEISPSCSIHFHQWDAKSSTGVTIGNYTDVTRKARLILSRMFGISSANVTNEELDLMTYESIREKLAGYDPWTTNVENEFQHFTQVGTGGIYNFESGYTVEDVDMIKHIKCPLKVWCAVGDSTLGVDVMKAYIKAIKNAGNTADIVIYPQQSSSHSWFNYQTTEGTVVLNGVSYPYKPIALDIATWYRSFGGYDPSQQHQDDGQLEYIETDGVAYIITGYQGKTPRSVKLKCLIPQLLTDNMTIIGGETSNSTTDNTRYIPVRINGNNYASLGYQNYYDCIDISQAISQGKTIEIYGRMKAGEQEMGVKVEGDENYTTHSEENTYDVASGKNMYIFAVNRNGTAARNCIPGTRLYYCQLCSNYDGTTVYRNLVPWRLNGEVGLMDTNSNTFFGNEAGSGAFIGGPLVTS